MTHRPLEHSSSVPDLIAELIRVKAAIRQTRKPTWPGADEVTPKELFRLYAWERDVVQRLRHRHREWRSKTAISEATLPETDTVGEPS
jgi:hypothetical protein